MPLISGSFVYLQVVEMLGAFRECAFASELQYEFAINVFIHGRMLHTFVGHQSLKASDAMCFQLETPTLPLESFRTTGPSVMLLGWVLEYPTLWWNAGMTRNSPVLETCCQGHVQNGCSSTMSAGTTR